MPLSVIKFVLKWFRTAPVATVKFGKKLLNKLIKVLKIEIVLSPVMNGELGGIQDEQL